DPKLVEQYQAAGASRYVFGLPAAPADTVLPLVANCAKLAREFGATVAA
ncbi:MAG: hypothetical protein JOZ65_05060, partial [Chloroflexi bacterium]|nr:hypothetical protein [Chloroflexota bacterium]